MRVPLRAFVDPSAQQLDLLVGQVRPVSAAASVRPGRAGDVLDQQALRRVARDDDARLDEGAVLGVEMEFGFALLFVGPVTGEAVVREDRQDFAVETDAAAAPCSLPARRAAPTDAPAIATDNTARPNAQADRAMRMRAS